MDSVNNTPPSNGNHDRSRFNPPPGWPTPPSGWSPPPGWRPNSEWPAPPPGWQLWITEDPQTPVEPALGTGGRDLWSTVRRHMRGRWGYAVIAVLFLVGLAGGLASGLVVAGVGALGVAAVALVNSFLRPAAKPRQRRTAAITAVAGVASFIFGGALAPAADPAFLAQPASTPAVSSIPTSSPTTQSPTPTAPTTSPTPAASSAATPTAADRRAAADAKARAETNAKAQAATKAAAAKTAAAKKKAAAKKAAAKKKAAAAKKAAAKKRNSNAYYANCDAVRAAGAAPIYTGDPGYSRKLDRDGDGVGCEY